VKILANMNNASADSVAIFCQFSTDYAHDFSLQTGRPMSPKHGWCTYTIFVCFECYILLISQQNETRMLTDRNKHVGIKYESHTKTNWLVKPKL